MVKPALIDASFEIGSQDRQLVHVYKDDRNNKIRVRIRRDSYPKQSWALAEVLTPGLTWTGLVSEPVDTWHDRTNLPANQSRLLLPMLEEIADSLAQRAVTVLS
jgi:hypothetical protein